MDEIIEVDLIELRSISKMKWDERGLIMGIDAEAR